MTNKHSLHPGAKASARDFAHPLLLWANDHCVLHASARSADLRTLPESERVAAKALERLLNSSGHLHWRLARSGWLLGSVTLQEMGEALRGFARGELAPAGLMFWSGQCRKVLQQAMGFYIALHSFLQAMRGDLQTQEYVDVVLAAATAMTTYLLTKDPLQPIYLQERQVALLHRSVIARNSGNAANPCTCQLYYQSMLRQAVNFWRSSFKPQHVKPGPSGDATHDAMLDLLVQEESPCTIIQERSWQWFVPPHHVLVFPEADQLTGVYACLPKRIITMTVCGQYWLYKRELAKAREHFYQVSMMLTFCIDCFDGSVQHFMDGQENTHLLGLAELFAYLGKVHPDASPFVGWNNSLWSAGLSAWPPELGAQRLLRPTFLQNAAVLPPFCFANGTLHLRVEGLHERKLNLFEFTGSWKLLPAAPHVAHVGETGHGRKAVLLFVDSPDTKLNELKLAHFGAQAQGI
eukprot:s889_g15.t1